MRTFIDELAEYILNTFTDMSKVVVVFPNRRPSLFLQRALGKLSQKPIFAPITFSIRDFVYQHAGLTPLDNISLLFRLYHVYNRVNAPGSGYAFEHFISSGELMLADFNDIDHYLVDPAALFSNLDKAKAIELWNPGKYELTPMEEDYLAFFLKLQVYYTEFVKEMKSDRCGYDGLAYRTLAEDILEGNTLVNSDCTHIFAGFNALNKAEEIILDHFVKNSGGCFFWDADTSYLHDEKQEAGMFLRSNLQKWSDQQPRQFGDFLLSTDKNINIIGAPLSLSQAKHTGLILKKISVDNPDHLNDTVVIPGDENTISMLLESLPPGIHHVNVTMGYPLKQSLIYQLMSAFIRIPVKSEKSIRTQSSLRIHYYDLLVLIRHPYFKYCSGMGDNDFGNALANHLLKLNRIFYSLEDLEHIFEELKSGNTPTANFLHELLSGISKPDELTDRCLMLCRRIEKALSKDDVITVSMVKSMSEVLYLLNNYISEAEFQLNLSVFELLFQRLTSNVHVPFEGEPLGGLQVMGYLETRCLDFANVIVTNFNEGFIPKGKGRMQTFIPFDLRKYFGMPLPSHDDAMYSYYFLRLLQRAQNIWILYNTEPDIFSGKEMSRFIRQIEFEYALKSKGKWKVDHQILRVNMQAVQSIKQYPGAVKSTEIIQLLEKRFAKGFSASALFNYVECPFRFYLNYILKIEEPKSHVAESVEMHVLGTVVHDTLKELYESAVNRQLDEGFFKTATGVYKSILHKLFRLNYAGGDMMSGKNLIIFEVACKMIRNVLREDKKVSEKETLIPLMIEKDMQVVLNEGNSQFRLFGKFDRVDKRANIIRIADYKTGKVDSLRLLKRGMSIDNLNFHDLDGKLFQLLFYMLLYRETPEQMNTGGFGLQSGIIPLKKADASFLPLEYSEKEKDIPDELFQRFRYFIFGVISEIMDLNTPFLRTSDTDKCKFCVYQSICSYFSPFVSDET
jgi:ATP-dependent helicase/nuclease subunit B